MTKRQQLAQAKNAALKVGRYIDGLVATIKMLQVVKPMSRNNKFPQEFSVSHHKSLEIIEKDLKSMWNEAVELEQNKIHKIEKLEEENK